MASAGVQRQYEHANNHGVDDAQAKSGSNVFGFEAIGKYEDCSAAVIAILQDSIPTHREARLKSVTGEHCEGGHWLGSFAVYLTTRRRAARGAHWREVGFVRC